MHRSRSRSMAVPVPVPAVLGAVPTHSKIVTVLVRNVTGTDRSSYRSGRSSGRFWPFPFPFCHSWVGTLSDIIDGHTLLYAGHLASVPGHSVTRDITLV